ncbi:MAG: NnrS family protein [Rhodovibrio sp.]|nr:NnrS family protein [Rhodovibrio sp.]
MACAVSGVIGAPAAMALDLLFFLALTGVLAREVIAGRNWRNLPVVGATLFVAVANALVHLEPVAGLDSGYGLRLAIGAFAFLIALIGGRIVPSFTRNWLAKRDPDHRPAPANRRDRAVVGLTGLAAAAWTLRPDHAVTGALAAAAALANAWRLARWQGHRTWREPLLLVLHVGYAWLAAGLGLIALAALTGAVPQTAALHALTAGAMGVMPAAVMTRATLGHTGRALTAGAGSAVLFALVALAAGLRVAAPMTGVWYLDLLALSALAWIAGFGLYVALYAPLQLRPRA